MIKTFCFAVCALLGLSGCQGNLKQLDLTWVKPQSTTRQQAIAKLGPPARVLDQNRVMAWRIAIKQPDQYDWSGSPIEQPSDCKVGDANQSLIFLFDLKGLLQQWQLVQLKGGRQMSLRATLGILMALTLTACIPYPTNRINEGSRHNISEQAVSFIEPGKTTRATVLLRLGEPDSVAPNESEYAYRVTRIIVSSAAYGSGQIDLVSSTQYFIISFRKDGRVLAVKQKSQKNYFPGGGTPEEK